MLLGWTKPVFFLIYFSKTGLVSSSWDRQFYFTQGGNLMSQGRGEVAGGLVMDIDNCSVMAVDCEDRRYCFQITSFDGKKFVFLPLLTYVFNNGETIRKYFLLPLIFSLKGGKERGINPCLSQVENLAGVRQVSVISQVI